MHVWKFSPLIPKLNGNGFILLNHVLQCLVRKREKGREGEGEGEGEGVTEKEKELK